MYGTIARLQAKPGTEGQLQRLMGEFEAIKVPGFIRSYVYRMDDDPNEYYLAVLFENKETYRANAASPEQDARYQQLLAVLSAPPEWHDGEIVYQTA